jgi:hypothetical protein
MHDAGLVSPQRNVPHLAAGVVLWLAGVGVSALYQRLRP